MRRKHLEKTQPPFSKECAVRPNSDGQREVIVGGIDRRHRLKAYTPKDQSCAEQVWSGLVWSFMKLI